MAKAFRFIFKGLGWLIALLLTAIALFVAFNWMLSRNMATAMGKPYAQVSHLQPQQTVKSCGVRAIPVSKVKPLPAETLAAMKAFSDKHKGLGLTVMIDGQIVLDHFAKGIGPQTQTQTLSLNKSVTALAVGAAINDGTLKSIDRPVGEYLPEWQGDARKDITLRNLMHMASGLQNYSMSTGDWNAMKLMLSDEIEDVALTAQPQVKPGTEMRYKNGDAQIAGAVLRRAIAKTHAGETYASFLSRTLWCPVGNGPATLWAESEDGAPRFYAGIQAGLHDFARLGQLILNDGKVGEKAVLPIGWVQQMTTPSPARMNYGFFIWRGTPWQKDRQYSPEAKIGAIHSVPYAADDVIFMDGYGGQRVYIVPSAKLVIARISEPDQKYDDAILVNLALAGLKTKSN
jgi:CubicO group peptidase (beta-lactamase class C family)